MKIQEMRINCLVVPLDELQLMVQEKWNKENNNEQIEVRGEVHFNLFDQPVFQFIKK